jgi:drug/metabolite transporter (DMT)-like permease
LVKDLVQRVPLPVLVWLRFALHMALACAIILGIPRYRKFARSSAPRRQFLRSTLLLITTTSFFLGLQFLPVADMVILTQAAPLMVLVLSVLLLRETVGPRRWLGVAAGFAGVLIVLKPGFGFEAASLFGIASAVIYALYQIMTRSLAAVDHVLTTFFYTSAAGTLLAFPFAVVEWQTPSGSDALLILLPGLVAGAGHLLLITAFARSEASLVAPFFYSAILWAVLFGWIWFGDVPDALTLAGATLIVGAGLYVWQRERERFKSRGQTGR